MEKQYSVQFFTSFVEHLQNVCRNHLDYSQFVEVSGYVCVEIDNVKKERYVLSELLQSSGNVVSESYCTKAFKTSRPMNTNRADESLQSQGKSWPGMNRSFPNRENIVPQNQNRRRSWAEPSGNDPQRVPPKVRRSSEIIEIIDDNQDDQRRETRNPSSQYYSTPSNFQQGQRWPASERTSAQRAPQNPGSVSRSQVNQLAQNPMAMSRAPANRTTQNPMAMSRAPVNQNPMAMSRAPVNQTTQNPMAMSRAPVNQTTQNPMAMSRAPVNQTTQNPMAMSRAPVNQNQMAMSRVPVNQNLMTMNRIPQQGPYSPMSRPPYDQMAPSGQQRPLARSAGSAVLHQTQSPEQGAGRVSMSGNQGQIQHQDLDPGRIGVAINQAQKQTDLGNIAQFNVQRPLPSPVSNVDSPVVKSEFNSEGGTTSGSGGPEPGRPNVSPASSLSHLKSGADHSSEQTSHTNLEINKTIKTEQVALECKILSGLDDDEIIDLDLFDDDMDDIQSDAPSPVGSKDDQAALAKDYGMSNVTPQRKEGSVNPGTQKVVAYAVKLFQNYHFNKSGMEVDPFAIEPEQLDDLLLDFYQGVRKMNGDELNARTLKNVQIHLDMYLRDQGYCHSIAKDEKFQGSRDFVKGRLDSYVCTQKYTAVDDVDIEILFQKQVLGCHSPDTLFNTMWFLNSKYFAIRRPMEHYNLKWSDIQMRTNDAGEEYLERRLNNSFSLKVFAQPQLPSRCFVTMYKKYCHMRPSESLYDTCPFYLSYKTGNSVSSDLWFLNEAMIWSRFQSMWRRLVVAGGLSQNKKIM